VAAFGAIGDLVSGALANPAAFAGALVQSVTIESNVSPPIVIPQPLASVGSPPAGGAPAAVVQPSLLLRLLAPKVTVVLPTGAPIIIAPAGDPKGTWPIGAFAVVLVLGFAVYGVACALRGR
jgi:hypothetical protein